jgi:hypothetical protein
MCQSIFGVRKSRLPAKRCLCIMSWPMSTPANPMLSRSTHHKSGDSTWSHLLSTMTQDPSPRIRCVSKRRPLPMHPGDQRDPSSGDLMYRSRATLDPKGTFCGVSSVSALHALFRGRLDASLSSRCLEFVLLEEENYRPGLPCPKMREASIDRRMALSRVRDRLHGSTVRMFDLVGRFASGREPKYGSSFTRY